MCVKREEMDTINCDRWLPLACTAGVKGCEETRPCSSHAGSVASPLEAHFVCGLCSMFGAQLVQKTTMLWGDDKKKAVKANPWVSNFCRK